MGIRLERLTKQFGQRTAVRDLSLEVRPGQIMGLLGPNGAGKSTTMRVLTGALQPTLGKAFINGVEVGSGDTSWKQGLGYLPEQNPLYRELYTYEYLRFVANLYRVRNVRRAIDRVATLTGLRGERSRRIGVLSKGYKQRVGLAAALIADPRTLILDEPTNGLDPNQIVEIRQLIREVGQEKAVLLSTHIMQEVEMLCDHVAIISAGELMAQGPTPEVVAQRDGRTYIAEFAQELPADALQNWFPDARIERLPGGEWALRMEGEQDPREEIFHRAVANGYTLLGLYQRASHLEDVFRQLTRD